MSTIKTRGFCTLITLLSAAAIWQQTQCTFHASSFLTKKSIQLESGASPQFSSSSAFEKISTAVFGEVHTPRTQSLVNQSSNIQDTRRRDFVLSTWTNRTFGGLRDQDRVLLARLYREANSVFEYGLGESTYIANYVGVPRYAGIDSSVEWIDTTRKKVSSHFRFYYGDTGDIGDWGFPADPFLAKSAWQYQLAPLQSELEPFDVYMVDGRWRVACSIASFLHASARGADTLTRLFLYMTAFNQSIPL